MKTCWMKQIRRLRTPEDFFDAAIGNIPFSNSPVYDPAYRRSPQMTRSIPDYFLTKTLDVVRRGGVLTLILKEKEPNDYIRLVCEGTSGRLTAFTESIHLAV